uniref:Uncharacterized protein ZC395.10-like n=1 Tax=Phallusia mammillata TaxID=59560 RepID=A0A6F9DPA2_9ASCI|nr:uncharacterized protein ZC395.10-like [Phallusia mammillata]
MTQDTNGHGDAKVTRPAPTLWAQSNDTLFLTFNVQDCKNVEVAFKPDCVEFSGRDRASVAFSNILTLFSEIKPEGCVWSKKGFGVECNIQKKTAGFWKRLLKDSAKNHWLKIDFQRWKDEDDSESEEEKGGGEPDLSQMMAQMGQGMPGGGMMNMDGMDEEEEEEDSDDDDIPELEESTTKQEDTPDA